MASTSSLTSSRSHVAAYLKSLRVSDASNRAIKERAASRPTVKQHLAAIRMLFDWLIVGQVLAINPAHAVRGPKHVVKRGKTPALTEDQDRRLLASIKVTKKVTLPDGSEAEVPSLVGLRDRALIGVMVYSFARITAVVAVEGRGLFFQRQALVGATAREGRQAPRNAGTPQARAVPRRVSRCGWYPRWRQDPPLPLRARPHWNTEQQADASHRCLSDGAPPH
jgi:site-specific recombinase XerC